MSVSPLSYDSSASDELSPQCEPKSRMDFIIDLMMWSVAGPVVVAGFELVSVFSIITAAPFWIGNEGRSQQYKCARYGELFIKPIAVPLLYLAKMFGLMYGVFHPKGGIVLHRFIDPPFSYMVKYNEPLFGKSTPEDVPAPLNDSQVSPPFSAETTSSTAHLKIDGRIVPFNVRTSLFPEASFYFKGFSSHSSLYNSLSSNVSSGFNWSNRLDFEKEK